MAGADSITLESLEMLYLIDSPKLTPMENIMQRMSLKANDLQFKWQVFLQEEFLLEVLEFIMSFMHLILLFDME